MLLLITCLCCLVCSLSMNPCLYTLQMKLFLVAYQEKKVCLPTLQSVVFTKLYTGPVDESKNHLPDILCVIQVHFLIFCCCEHSVCFFPLNFLMVQFSVLHNQIPLQYTHVNELILNNLLMIIVKKDKYSWSKWVVTNYTTAACEGTCLQLKNFQFNQLIGVFVVTD